MTNSPRTIMTGQDTFHEKHFKTNVMHKYKYAQT